jgi:hypothetical protein
MLSVWTLQQQDMQDQDLIATDAKLQTRRHCCFHGWIRSVFTLSTIGRALVMHIWLWSLNGIVWRTPAVAMNHPIYLSRQH